MTARKVPHRPGGGCKCKTCERKREYQRERYAAQKDKREMAKDPYATPNAKEHISARNRQERNQEPRLHEREQGGGSTAFHWLPKGEDEWECPVCEMNFARVSDGTWVIP